MRLVWSVLAGLVLAAGAVAQELPWYEVKTLGAGTTIDLYDSGYYTLSTDGFPITRQLFDPNGNPVNLDFNVRNVDQFGVAYGSTKVTPGYQSQGASQDIKNGGPVRVYSNMNLLDGGNSDLVFGQNVPNRGFPWAATSVDPNDLSKFGRPGELIDMNKSGASILSTSNSNPRSSKDVVYVPGQGYVELPEAASGPNGEKFQNFSFSSVKRIADDGAILGRSGNFGTPFVPIYSLVVWDTATSQPRFIDINNLSQQDIDRFGVFIQANEIYGAGGVHSELADRIVNPAGDAYYSNLAQTRDGTLFGTVGYTNAEGVFVSEAFVAKPVPEPATIAVIGLGVCGLVLRRRRRAN